jgi:methyl-accepting chemotaxis protein
MATPAIALELAAGPRPAVTGNKTTEPHWLIGSGNLAQSFWIAGALFVLPIAAMVYFVVTDLSAQIEFADKERLGVEYIAPLVRFQRAVIDYRTGVASPAVDGTSEATEADLAAAVERAAQEVGAADQLNGGTLRVADLWEMASRDWTRIKSRMHDATREERLATTDTCSRG